MSWYNHYFFKGMTHPINSFTPYHASDGMQKRKKSFLNFPLAETHLMMFSYSFSLPLESRHFLNMTDASTLAGENVFGSFSSEMTLSSTVLQLDERIHYIWSAACKNNVCHTKYSGPLDSNSMPHWGYYVIMKLQLNHVVRTTSAVHCHLLLSRCVIWISWGIYSLIKKKIKHPSHIMQHPGCCTFAIVCYSFRHREVQSNGSEGL